MSERTHYEGCWRHHHACLVAKAMQLMAEVTQLQTKVRSLERRCRLAESEAPEVYVGVFHWDAHVFHVGTDPEQATEAARLACRDSGEPVSLEVWCNGEYLGEHPF